jgi:hypothetical protein
LRQLCRAFALTAGKDELGFVVMQFHHEKEVHLRQNGGRHEGSTELAIMTG